MKPNTKRHLTVLDTRLAARIMRTHGLAAGIAKCGGFGRSFVSDVLHGRKAPSSRFFEAAIEAVEELTGNFTLHILRQQLTHEVKRRGLDKAKA